MSGCLIPSREGAQRSLLVCLKLERLSADHSSSCRDAKRSGETKKNWLAPFSDAEMAVRAPLFLAAGG